MQSNLRKSALSLALAASALGTATWSPASHACNSDPFIGSICIMAWPKANGFGNVYLPAIGTQMQLSQYQALYAVIGITYGGNGSSNFNLPDLQGRVLIGAGRNSDTGAIYNYGQKGGAASFTMTAAQIPAHSHTLNNGTPKLVTTAWALGTLAATTTLTGLSATTSLSGVTATASASGLALNGSSGGNLTTSPSNASLGSYTSATKIYSDAAPSVAMKAGSISGTAPVTFSGTPTTTISGNPTTTLSGTPVVTVGGATDPYGSAPAVNIPTMPPYVAMSFYIAVNGLFPVID